MVISIFVTIIYYLKMLFLLKNIEYECINYPISKYMPIVVSFEQIHRNNNLTGSNDLSVVHFQHIVQLYGLLKTHNFNHKKYYNLFKF